jgi:hypothetical protein
LNSDCASGGSVDTPRSISILIRRSRCSLQHLALIREEHRNAKRLVRRLHITKLANPGSDEIDKFTTTVRVLGRIQHAVDNLVARLTRRSSSHVYDGIGEVTLRESAAQLLEGDVGRLAEGV